MHKILISRPQVNLLRKCISKRMFTSGEPGVPTKLLNEYELEQVTELMK